MIPEHINKIIKKSMHDYFEALRGQGFPDVADKMEKTWDDQQALSEAERIIKNDMSSM